MNILMNLRKCANHPYLFDGKCANHPYLFDGKPKLVHCTLHVMHPLVTHSPSIPTHSPSIPTHSSSIPTHSPSIPTHSPSIPTHSPSIPTHSPPLLPMHAPFSAIQVLSRSPLRLENTSLMSAVSVYRSFLSLQLWTQGRMLQTREYSPVATVSSAVVRYR